MLQWRGVNADGTGRQMFDRGKRRPWIPARTRSTPIAGRCSSTLQASSPIMTGWSASWLNGSEKPFLGENHVLSLPTFGATGMLLDDCGAGLPRSKSSPFGNEGGLAWNTAA
jgi:hypothetical protein